MFLQRYFLWKTLVVSGHSLFKVLFKLRIIQCIYKIFSFVTWLLFHYISGNIINFFFQYFRNMKQNDRKQKANITLRDLKLQLLAKYQRWIWIIPYVCFYTQTAWRHFAIFTSACKPEFWMTPWPFGISMTVKLMNKCLSCLQELGYWSITECHGDILYMKGLSFLHSPWRELRIHNSQ